MRSDSNGGSRPRLLDLFCGAGGCTKGYQRAGFYVVSGWQQVSERPSHEKVGRPDTAQAADAHGGRSLSWWKAFTWGRQPIPPPPSDYQADLVRVSSELFSAWQNALELIAATSPKGEFAGDVARRALEPYLPLSRAREFS